MTRAVNEGAWVIKSHHSYLQRDLANLSFGAKSTARRFLTRDMSTGETPSGELRVCVSLVGPGINGHVGRHDAEWISLTPEVAKHLWELLGTSRYWEKR